MLCGGEKPPGVEVIRALILEKWNEQHIRKTARVVKDASVERLSTPSDVSNVRTAAQSSDARAPEDKSAEICDTLKPDMETIGILKCPKQEMSAVIGGIARALDTNSSDISSDDVNTGIDADAIGDANATKPLFARRAADACDDYGQAATGLYMAWWSLFPLHRGLQEGTVLSNKKMRHLFLYHDNRFSSDLSLIFSFGKR